VTPLQAYTLPGGASNGTLRSEYCMSYPSGEQVPEAGGKFYVSNVLAELDVPGEWYWNRTSGTVYVWPTAPLPPSGPIAFLSLADDLVDVFGEAGAAGRRQCGTVSVGAHACQGARSNPPPPPLHRADQEDVTISGIDFRFGRGVGINIAGSSGITVDGVTLYGIGSTGINITDGAGVTVQVRGWRRGGGG
jgi:hypothetical protein